ncbi:MAG: carbohydrate porin [Cyanobium sp.]
MDLDLTLTADPLQGNAPGGIISGAWIQQLVIEAHFGTGLARNKPPWREIDHWLLSLGLSQYSGDPNLNIALDTAFPLQTTAHPVGLWLTEAAIERRAAGGTMTVKAGVMPLNPEFVETPVLNSYIHAALNNTLNLNTAGVPINPFATPAVMAQLRLWEGSELGIGQFWLAPVAGIAALFGVTPQQVTDGGTLQILQWSLNDLPGSTGLAKPLLTNGQTINRQLPTPRLLLGGYNSSGSQTNRVLYGVATLATNLPFALDHRFWLGFNRGLNAANNPNPSFLAGGLLSQGVVPGRPLDVLAIAYGSTSFSSQLTPGLASEGVLEVNYTLPVSRQLTIQPVVQWILNPAGNSTRRAVVAGGMQLSLSF